MPGYCVQGTIGHKILNGQRKLEMEGRATVRLTLYSQDGKKNWGVSRWSHIVYSHPPQSFHPISFFCEFGCSKDPKTTNFTIFHYIQASLEEQIINT